MPIILFARHSVCFLGPYMYFSVVSSRLHKYKIIWLVLWLIRNNGGHKRRADAIQATPTDINSGFSVFRRKLFSYLQHVRLSVQMVVRTSACSSVCLFACHGRVTFGWLDFVPSFAISPWHAYSRCHGQTIVKSFHKFSFWIYINNLV